MKLVESVGYWIIFILIALAGTLVLLAASSVDVGDENESLPTTAIPTAGAVSAGMGREPRPPETVPVVILVPRWWRQLEQGIYLTPTAIPGTSVDVRLVDDAKMSALADTIESAETDLRDAVVTFVAGPDDFLASHTLESTIDKLDRLLDRLSDLPAMAVIGSIPDLAHALADDEIDVPVESLSATFSVWNDAVADLARSYSAEFVDLRSVPVKLFETVGQTSSIDCPDVAELMNALTPAICRAAERVRSYRAHS